MGEAFAGGCTRPDGSRVTLRDGRGATILGRHEHPVYGECYRLVIDGVGPGGGWQDRDLAPEATSAKRAEYEAAGAEASDHFKAHGNVMSPERARILRRLTAARVALNDEHTCQGCGVPVDLHSPLCDACGEAYDRDPGND